MKEEKSLMFAGDLLEEVNEVNRLVPTERNVEVTNTHTAVCSPLLTIYCC
ncbi:hypothetical protein [Faecalicatena orotica]